AEDGIRDGHVTGVQTCALPILKATTTWPPRSTKPARSTIAPATCNKQRTYTTSAWNATRTTPSATAAWPYCSTKPAANKKHSNRSEERRVGKECKTRRAAE